MIHIENPEFQTVFMFFSRSVDVYPGYGKDEVIHNTHVAQYDELSNIPDWRKKLSNFYARDDIDAPLFILDDLHWRSVEHYFQAAKFLNKDLEYFKTFALESGSNLSRASGPTVKRAGRRLKLTQAEVFDWDTRKDDVLARAREAKFIQNTDCAKALVLTKDALLTHRASARSQLYHETALMSLRKKLMTVLEQS